MSGLYDSVNTLLTDVGAMFVASGRSAAYAVFLAGLALVPVRLRYASLVGDVGSPLPDTVPRFGREHMTRLLAALRAEGAGDTDGGRLRRRYVHALGLDIAYAVVYTPLLAIGAATAVSRLLPDRGALPGVAVLLAVTLLITDQVENVTSIRVVNSVDPADSKALGDDSWLRRVRRAATWLKFLLLGVVAAVIGAGLVWALTIPSS